MDQTGNKTIYDVAEAAGVSITTVSRYWNAPHKVGEATRQKIHDAMMRLNYVPQVEAQIRSKEIVKRIGVLTPFFPAPSFVKRLQGVASVVNATQYELAIYTVNRPEQLATYLATLPLANRVDGLIIMSMSVDADEAQHLIRKKIPTVTVEFNNGIFDCIEADNEEGGRMAARFFRSKGYNSVAVLGEINAPPYSLHPCDQRVQGFKNEARELGLELPERCLLASEFDLDDATRVVTEFLSRPQSPRALFAVTDIQAIGAVNAARSLGFRVPEDFAVLGFDDLDEARYCSLSTISQHLFESGKVAAELVISMMKESSEIRRHIRLATEVVERKTT